MNKPLQSEDEIKELLYLVYKTKDIDGNLAEVGVYWGGSANIIRSTMNPSKTLYLYDTFDGFKDLTDRDYQPLNDIHQFGGCYEQVMSEFNYPNVKVIKGYFPSTAIEDKFSFVHLDADTYQSTLNSLEFFYPRMNVDGVILLHDYLNTSVLVKEAADKFFKDKGEKVTPMQTSQGYIIKQ